jgi:hypothetical protein
VAVTLPLNRRLETQMLIKLVDEYIGFTGGRVIETTEGRLLEGVTQEETKRRILDDLCTDFEHDVANLQG